MLCFLDKFITPSLFDALIYQIGIPNKPTTHYTRTWEETLQARCWAVVTYLLVMSPFLCFFALFSLQMFIHLREVYLPLIMLLYSAICTQYHCTVAKPKACNQKFKKKKKKQHNKQTGNGARAYQRTHCETKWIVLKLFFRSNQKPHLSVMIITEVESSGVPFICLIVCMTCIKVNGKKLSAVLLINHIFPYLKNPKNTTLYSYW